MAEEAIPDLSAVKSGFMADLIGGGKVTKRVILSEAVVNSIRRAAESGDIIGLEELDKLKGIAEQVGVEISLKEEQRRFDDPDEAVLRLAHEGGHCLVTSSERLARIANSISICVLKGRTKLSEQPLYTKYLRDDLMSLHLKEDLPPRGKAGCPGSWRLVDLSDEPMKREELDRIVRDILERTEAGEGFLEVKREGSNIAMLGNNRIIITFPPFSDRLEVTITRKLTELELEQYSMDERLIDRFSERAEGVAIAGAPGMGKTTFAQALAKFYLRRNKIIKTIESPRDLRLPPTATQYSKTRSSSEELHDVLLLSRPDYTFFDEMRDTEDFRIFTDLRLAGVGMVGVIHAATPIDAIQRFIGRVELGVIPSIIDTVVFINKGDVEKVYGLETSVKIPHGLTESDLARPVVLVRNYSTGDVEYEIYVFGERTFVVPVKGKKERPKDQMMRAMVDRILGKYVPTDGLGFELCGRELIVSVPPERLPVVMKRTSKKLKRLEDKLGVKVTLKPAV